MKVLLIRPYWRVPLICYPPGVSEPLGLEYLASAIREDHDVSILDCLFEDYKCWDQKDFIVDKYGQKLIHIGLKPDKIIKHVKKLDPEVVGIGYDFFPQLPCAKEVSKLIKEVNNDIVVVAGGAQASCDQIGTLQGDSNVDMVVIGEGEITFKELLDKKIKNLGDIKGLAYRKGHEIIKTAPRPPITDLDTIPFPARDLIPFNNYSKVRRRSTRWILDKITNRVFNLPFVVDIFDYIFAYKFKIGLPTANILTSRGCPYSCYFCPIHNIWGRKYRMRSAENVLEELHLLIDQYGIKSFLIQDDNFTVSKKRALEICKGLEKLGLSYQIPSGVYIPSLDRELLEWIKRSGCSVLSFGIENGNQKFLNDVINKKINLNQVKEVIALCKDIGITTIGFFILGIPGETTQTMKDTINFAATSRVDKARIYTCMPIPGTRLYEDCVKQDAIKDLDPIKIMVQTAPVIETDKFSVQDVEELRKMAKKILKERYSM